MNTFVFATCQTLIFCNNWFIIFKNKKTSQINLSHFSFLYSSLFSPFCRKKVSEFDICLMCLLMLFHTNILLYLLSQKPR